MRCCPKCGERFTDTDFRTLCSSCMVSLVPCDESSSGDSASAAGPVTVGGTMTQTMVMPTVTMPEITIPEVSLPHVPAPEPPSEVPQIPPVPKQPQPGPGPIPPPLTPQPDPEHPQPTIIPTPEPTPEPTKPASTSRAIAPTLADAMTPASAPKPATALTRKLSAEEVVSGKAASSTSGIAGAITAIIAIISLASTDPTSFSFFHFVFTGGLIFLAVYLIRQAIYRSAIHKVEVVQQAGAMLGGPLRFRMTVGTLRDVQVTDAVLVITGVERVVYGSGKQQQTLLHQFYNKRLHFSAPKHWPKGSLLTFEPEVMLPADAMPSFSGDHHYIEWSAALWVGIPGWYPDIRHKLKLSIPPLRAGQSLPPSAPQQYSLPELRDLCADITLDCAAGTDRVPIIAAGRTIPVTLHIQPRKSAVNSAVWVELAYVITGTNSKEQKTVSRMKFFPNGWKEGKEQREHQLVKIPPNAPITYRGLHMNVSWMISVVKEEGWHRGPRQVFEVRVVPEDGG